MAGSYCCRPVGVKSRARCLTVAGWMFLATGGLLCAEDAPTFFRGLNLNGPPVTIDGHLWEGRDSENYTCRDKAFDNQNVPLLPSTDAARAEMIRSSRWGGNRVELKNIPNDSYTVFLYVWEDNNAETYSISVNDREVQSRYNSGVTGHWDRLGPWYVDATTSQIVIASSGGTANFSGVEIWRGRHDGVYAEPLKPEDLAFFESRIRPLLVKHCYECHSAEADELQAALLVDSQPMLRRGGVTGPAVVPGDVEHSLLIEAVRYENEDMQMPPDGKLAAAEIADLERWVSIGAPDPRHTATRFVRRTIDVEEARKFWSLRPLTEPVVPAVRDTSWPFSDIDRFIMARLEQQQLDPVGLADKRTLIRRVSFDLTGLPPSPDQVETFLADESPEAFERIVNQLLESPRYGEYWGRHWMDLVRYADTAGDNSDYPVPQAYLYRNYIIDSFNADKPYDQFLCEQIAGDLLPAENEAQRNEQLIATGYLAISRRFGSVIQDYPQHLTIEDTIDNLGRTVLGLTISCARCHNHKFDPVSQDDYYALYGIFNSTRYPFPGIELVDSGSRPNWDSHGEMKEHIPLAKASDQPLAALIRDLKERGLFEETLIVWATEFGRTPTREGKNGRGHHGNCFSVWLAGAGIRGGIVHGETDDIGREIVRDKVDVHDLHATILHLMGIDHTRLTYRHAGRDFRLTDVHGNLIENILT